MATHEDYPGISSFKDRNGATRWRFRHGGRTVSLRGQPGEPGFDAAYMAARTGQARPSDVQPIGFAGAPGLPAARTMADAWARWKKSHKWKTASPLTRQKNESLASRLLATPVAPGSALTWADAPMADLKRRHILQILADNSDTPHKAKHILVAIRKMITVALDEEWIDHDPSARISWRPAYGGWRAWTPDEMKAFCTRWPIGTTPRLVFSIALWLGNRRSDLASLKWSDRVTRTLTEAGQPRIVRGFEIVQHKTGKALFVPEAPQLTAALDAARATAPAGIDEIVVTAYGKPFSEKSLTGRMADWTRSAGLPQGCTIHGLRKTLGKRMAEGGASTRQLMTILGHETIAHAELYSRDADSIRLAVDAMDKVVAMFADG